MSNIFQEALADAKKLKEVAEENAKKVILESVTPKIREFIEEQLLEDSILEEEMDESDEIEEEIDEESMLNLFEMIGAKDMLNSLSESDKKVVLSHSIENAISRMTQQEKSKIQEIANKFNQNKENLSSNKINNNVVTNQENDSMPSKEKYYEVDLQALREAVEMEKEALELAEIYEDDEDDAVKEMDELDMDMDEDDIMKEISYLFEQEDDEDSDLPLEDAESEDDEDSEPPSEDESNMVDLGDVRTAIDGALDGLESGGAGELGDMPDMPDMDDMGAIEGEPADEEPINEVFDVDPQMLREELANIKRQLSEGSVDHHFGGKGGSKAGVKGAFGGTGAKKAGYQKSFGGGSYGQDPFTNPPQINKLNEAIRKLRRMNRSQGEKLNKYRSAVQTLREQLEDLNLFNAKLLYVNKLLQNKALTESQKKSVIKALDEANNINETKALYKSLTESLSSSKGKLNESTRFGSSSRVTTSSTSSKKIVGEIGRWQKLAGLK